MAEIVLLAIKRLLHQLAPVVAEKQKLDASAAEKNDELDGVLDAHSGLRIYFSCINF